MTVYRLSTDGTDNGDYTAGSDGGKNAPYLIFRGSRERDLIQGLHYTTSYNSLAYPGSTAISLPNQFPTELDGENYYMLSNPTVLLTSPGGSKPSKDDPESFYANFYAEIDFMAAGGGGYYDWGFNYSSIKRGLYDLYDYSPYPDTEKSDLTLTVNGYNVPMYKATLPIFVDASTMETKVEGSIDVSIKEYWPYANSQGQPVWDTTTGAQLVDPAS